MSADRGDASWEVRRAPWEQNCRVDCVLTAHFGDYEARGGEGDGEEASRCANEGRRGNGGLVR